MKDSRPAKQSLLDFLVNAGSGALKAIFLWYLANSFIDGAGINFLLGLGWPISTAWIVVAIGAVVEILFKLPRGRLRLRRKREALFETEAAIDTADLGLEYKGSVPRPSFTMPCFDHWHSSQHGTVGRFGDVSVSVFDMTELISTEEGDCRNDRMFAVLPASGLPKISLTPRFLGGWLAHTFRQSSMTFEPVNLPTAEKNVVQQFVKAFKLATLDNTWLFNDSEENPQANQAIIRKLFSPSLMREMLKHSDWSFQTDGELLACWRGFNGKYVARSVDETANIMATGIAIRAALLTALTNLPSVGLPPMQLPNSKQYGARAVGACCGLLLGSFGAFFGIAGAVVEHKWFALLPFVGAAVGAVAGAVIGYWIGAAVGRLPAIANPRPATEESPQMKLRRGKWAASSGCFGLFAGSFGGFWVYIFIDKFVFGKGGAQGGWVALFPICLFGGLIAGLFVGASLGGRIPRRREPEV